MKLFLLERLDETDWDESEGFVIRAKDEVSARVIAGEQDNNNNKSRWMDHQRTSCNEISQDGHEGVILESFNAG